jgi:SAM-dependent methyltransferase
MFSEMEGIRKLCQDAMALFEWSAVPLGHPLRNHHYAYPAWGIALTGANVEEIRRESKKQYRCEWADSDETLNALIATACTRAGLLDTNLLLNQRIADCASRHLKRLGKGPKNIVEIGTGAGGTITAALERMRAMKLDLSELSITLVEPSMKRLAFAQERIRQEFGESHPSQPNIVAFAGTVDAISRLPAEHADLVIQNAAIHHESFKDHLALIHRILRPGMPFVSGDWHEGTYETPARIYWLYAMLQEPANVGVSSAVLDFVLGSNRVPNPKVRNELTEFRRLFRISDDALFSAFDQFTDSERRASAGGMKYWLEMAKIFTEEGRRSPEVVIQCHERVAMRTAALINAGFTFDRESRAKYCEVIRDKGFGELGAVMVPKKPAAGSGRRAA